MAVHSVPQQKEKVQKTEARPTQVQVHLRKIKRSEKTKLEEKKLNSEQELL